MEWWKALRAHIFPSAPKDTDTPAPTTRLTPGTAVQLVGDSIILRRWARSLPPEFDPHVEVYERGGTTNYILRSGKFALLTDPVEVRAEAISLLDRLNGALSAFNRNSHRVTGGAVLQISSTGGIQHSLHLASSVVAVADMELSASGQTFDAQGNPLMPSSPEPSYAQLCLALAGAEEEVDDLLTYAGRADNWYDLFKLHESAVAVAGDPKIFASIVGPEAKRVGLLKYSANLHRHRRPEPTPPGKSAPTPLAFEEARTVALWLADVTLRFALARRPPTV